jgi:hypothetical protein
MYGPIVTFIICLNQRCRQNNHHCLIAMSSRRLVI